MSTTITGPLAVPRRTGTLPVGDGHTLAWQEFGAAQGRPALVLHGGPGSALAPSLVRFFELQAWRVIGFDQRGCGASTPRGSTVANDTEHVLRDIEAVRLALGVSRWCVVGGSWGATLALAYAARYPQAVSALVLRGLFVPEPAELRWFFQDARELAPRAWDDLAGLAPHASRGDLVPWLAEVFQHGDAEVQAPVALAWRAWEQALAGEAAVPPSDLQAVIARYRIQSHYLAHGCWLGDGALRVAARDLPTTPVHLLHGANDVVCRPDAARALHKLIPHSRFHTVPHVGHDPMHPAMVAAMQATLRSLREEEHA